MSFTNLAQSQTLYSHEECTRVTDQSSDCLRLTSALSMLLAALFGTWGLTCLINGLVKITELRELGRALFTACTGAHLG